jgi:hypothetical protein
MSTVQLVALAVVAIFGALYVMRRRSRLNRED